MKSSKRGKSISVEVQGIQKHGVWIFVKGNEYFLPYRSYPWFKNSQTSEIFNVKLVNNKYLHWPTLDIDLEMKSIMKPHQYPLIYR